MANIIDTIGKLPKGAVIALGVVLVGGLGYGMYWLSFGSKKTEEEVVENIDLGVPDAPIDDYQTTATSEFANRNKSSKVADYWSSLGDEEEDADPPVSVAMNDNLDPNEYTDLERYQIINGLRSKEAIDQEHARDKAAQAAQEEAERRRQAAAAATQQKPMTREQQDSLYFARLERAYALAAKYTAPAAEEVEEEKPEEPAERTINPEGNPSLLPTEALADDGIITSLDDPSDNGVVHYGGQSRAKPVKATFLKNERLTSGNRVIIRLLQDMLLADGTTIPANTHITGTCSFSKRLKINVTMLHYNGRMFPVDISVYDNDGTEGIYCPLAEESNSAKKKAKKVAGDVVQSAGTIAGTLVTGNPLIGRMATQGIQSATSNVGSDGSISVNVSAGYEFYVFENVKDDQNR